MSLYFALYTVENNKNKKSVKFQGDMLNFCDFIQVFVFTTNHHLKYRNLISGTKIFGSAICINFLNSENLICRSTDISKCFRGSLQRQDNES